MTAFVWQYSTQVPVSSHLSWPSVDEQEQVWLKLSMLHLEVPLQSLSRMQRPGCRTPADATQQDGMGDDTLHVFLSLSS
jgi:hypothetical protein